MTIQFLHGVEVIEIDSGPRPVRTVKSGVIGIVGTAPGAAPAASASLLTGVEQNNNGLTWTAVSAGAAGNDVSVFLQNPQANSAALAVAVNGTVITVSLATDVSGVITSTAGDVITAITADTAASALLSVANTGASTGLGVMTANSKQLALSGGLDEPFPLDTPALVAGSRTEAALLGTTGTLPAAMDAIFDQTGALVVVIRVAADADPNVEKANVIGGSTTSTRTGVHALQDAEAKVFAEPKLLIAPGYTNDVSVVSEMLGIADTLRAIIIADGPNTDDDAAKTYRGNFGSNRVYLVDPSVTVFDTLVNAEVTQPSSARVAGIIAKSDNERGFWWSPSNREMFGITGTSRQIDFTLGDANSRANLLNENEVTTIIRKDGFRLWGNRTTSSDPKWAFINVRRTADMINESLLRAHMWAVDRNISRNYIDAVLESVESYLRELKALGAIINGSVWVDPDLNTPEAIAAGHVYFDFDFSANPPAEHITFRSHLVNDYLVEVLPQAA